MTIKKPTVTTEMWNIATKNSMNRAYPIEKKGKANTGYYMVLLFIPFTPISERTFYVFWIFASSDFKIWEIADKSIVQADFKKQT